MSRRRRLHPDELALWRQVADRTERLHRQRRGPPEAPSQHPAPPPRGETAMPPLPEFRLGEATQGRAPGHDLAPTLSERLAQAPLRMDRKTHARLRRGRLDPEARIDLHGMTLDEAHPALTGFILSSQAAGRRLVLVITGKGRRGEDSGPIPRRRGVLRHQVPHWLHSPPLNQAVLQVSEAHLRHGGSGAFYVYLRRIR